MEGDAGASRLNPIEAEQTGPQATTEESTESEGGADKTASVATTEDSTDSEVEAPTSAADDSTESEPDTHDLGGAPERGPSRLRRGWVAAIAAALLISAGALGVGGYFALRTHQQNQTIARNDVAALKQAMDCVTATQAPDTDAMAASEQKIIDCGTDTFRTQALLYTSMLVQAYQAANVHVQVADVRAAVERNNPDGSVDILVALRVKVASDQSQSETGYRLRVKMANAEGQYRIARLDQVTK